MCYFSGNGSSHIIWSLALMKTTLCIHLWTWHKSGEGICQNSKCFPQRRQAAHIHIYVYRYKHVHIHIQIIIRCDLNVLCLFPKDVKISPITSCLWGSLIFQPPYSIHSYINSFNKHFLSSWARHTVVFLCIWSHSSLASLQTTLNSEGRVNL